MGELMRPLFAQFATRYTNTAHRFIAEGGQLKEVIEYMDTELVATTLER